MNIDSLLLAPFQAVRRDLERIKATVDDILDPLLELPLLLDNPGHNPGLPVEENLLTPAQHEVLRLARLGLSNREIAGELGIDPGTVRNHFRDIRRQVGVPTREAAVAAFGKPTEITERVGFRELWAPVVTAAPLERRAAGLLALVDELERHPSLETVGRLEAELLDLAAEIARAIPLTAGPERDRLTDLHEALSRAVRDTDLAREQVEVMERETLPRRIETARRGVSSAVRMLRGDLLAPAGLQRISVVTGKVSIGSRFIGRCRVDEGECLTHGYSVSATVPCPWSELSDDEWQAVWELAEAAFPDGQDNPGGHDNPEIDSWWPGTMAEVERAVSNYAVALRGAAARYARSAREAAARYSASAEKAIQGYRQHTLAEFYKGQARRPQLATSPV